MTEILLVGAIWGMALGARFIPGAPAGLRDLSRGLGREHAALVLLMMTTHSNTVRAGAESALTNPFVGPVVLRGIFALGALIIIVPLFVPEARFGLAVRRRWYGLLAFGLYLAVGYLSVLYSTAPLVTAGKVFELGILFMLLWVIASRPDPSDGARRTIGFALYLEATLLAVAIAGFFLVPSLFSEAQSRRGFAFAETMVSPYAEPNGMASLGSLLAAFGLAMYLTRRNTSKSGRWIGLSLLGAAGTVLASGRQGVIILLVSAAILTFVYRREILFIVIAPLTALFVMSNWRTLLDVLSRDQVEGSLTTLTGRTVFWRLAIEGFGRRPLTGYGFGAGSRYGALRDGGYDEFTHLHNGFLEALVGVGLLGFIPYVFATVRVVWWAFVRVFNKVEVPYAILIVPLLFKNVIGLGFGGWLNINLILFGLLVVLSDVQGLRLRPQPRGSQAATQAR
jgi:O-antigen ligase